MLIQYIDGIYVCDIKTSFEKTLYTKYDINIVLNFTVDYPFVDLNIKKTRIPVSNILNYHTDMPLIKNNLSTILKYIYNNFIDHNILICCHDGNTISPTIVGLFLHKYANIEMNTVKDLLKSKNKNVNIEYDLNIFL
jgi:hypothetical protein